MIITEARKTGDAAAGRHHFFFFSSSGDAGEPSSSVPREAEMLKDAVVAVLRIVKRKPDRLCRKVRLEPDPVPRRSSWMVGLSESTNAFVISAPER